MKTKLNALSAWLDRHALPLGAVLAAALSLLLALYNVGGGPLGNLNDIGGWRNRALYIALTAAVQLFVLLAAALLYHERFWRLAVRQLLLTVGLVILLMGVNHKSYLFVEQMLPFVRRMDAAGLSAMNDMRLNLSAPAVTALYLLTRGPIYDMYMLKLACMGAFMLMAVLAAHAADRRGWGLRSEALLLLCLILPQGFLAAGSAPQIDALSALLLVAALTLMKSIRWAACCSTARRLRCPARHCMPCRWSPCWAEGAARRGGMPRWRRSSRWRPACPRCFAACLPDARRAACSPRISLCRSMRRAFRT